MPRHVGFFRPIFVSLGFWEKCNEFCFDWEIDMITGRVSASPGIQDDSASCILETCVGLWGINKYTLRLHDLCWLVGAQ